MTNSTLRGNSALRSGGGIWNGAAMLTVTNSVLLGNAVNSSGGGVFNASGTVNVTDSTLSGNSAGSNGSGGGIFNGAGTLTMTSSTLSLNFAFNGGGIHHNGGATTMTNSTLSGNMAGGGGGGIFSTSTLDVTNSTLSGNTANSGGGMLINGSATVTNSTVSGNSATGSGAEGGGIFVGTGNLTLVRSLVSGNSSDSNGDEITIGIGSITANAFNVFGHSGQSNALAFNGFVPGANDFNATTSGTPVALANILDTTLAGNGGPTETHALVAGSPAIDLGPTAACAAAPVDGLDQRGEPRNVDGNGVASANECDAGAYEYQPPPTGTITIIKSADPADDTIFSFTDDIKSPNSFTLQDPADDTKTFSNVPTGGSYTVTELDTPGWPLTNLACSAAGSSTFDDTNLAGGFAVVTNLVEGDTVECTFTNTQCQPGFYDAGGNECVPAPAGSFVPDAGATSPTECLAGTFQDQEGQAACKDADPGNFVPGPGATEQTECLAGTFQDQAGQTACIDADPGNFVPGPGATEQTECSPGSWQDQSGADSCKLADPGFFVPGFGATEQLACKPGFTSEAGATECTAIPPASACPVDPADGTVGAELTTLLGTGMGSPTRTKMVAKVTIPNAST